MRDLTIKRKKSFVACLMQMKIYAEDPAGDTEIDGTLCRLLGTLGNGEEKTFPIGEEEMRVFVIADGLSKGYCSDYYRVPAGSGNVFLSGKNRLNPASGNAFRFDDNDTEEVRASRRKGTRRGTVVMAVSVVVGLIIGFSAVYVAMALTRSEAYTKEKTFTSEGVTLTLTEDFKKFRYEGAGFVSAYDSKRVAVFVFRDDFSTGEEALTLSVGEYIDAVISSNNIVTLGKNTEADPAYYIYDYRNPDDGKTYIYYSYVYKAGDAFYTVRFAVEDKYSEDLAPKIEKWAGSAKFS